LDEDFEAEPRPYSLGTIANHLHSHGNKLSYAHLQTLGICMAKQARDYCNTTKTAVKDAERLAGELSDIRIAEAQALGNDPPAGYITNDGHLPHFLIPDSAGVYAVTRYVQSPTTDPTTAFGTMGGTCDPVYATTIQATPSKSVCSKPSPLPTWFLGILNSPKSGFRLLEKEA
jgi:hypothetical protein